MSLKGKILTYLLPIVMFINAVGVAQVSHICKLAVAGMEETSCSSETAKTHPCCNTDLELEGILSANNNCCTDIIKYYHQKVNTTIQSALKINLQNFFISLFVYPVPEPVLLTDKKFLNDAHFIFEHPGTSILIDLQTFLI